MPGSSQNGDSNSDWDVCKNRKARSFLNRLFSIIHFRSDVTGYNSFNLPFLILNSCLYNIYVVIVILLCRINFTRSPTRSVYYFSSDNGPFLVIANFSLKKRIEVEHEIHPTNSL